MSLPSEFGEGWSLLSVCLTPHIFLRSPIILTISNLNPRMPFMHSFLVAVSNSKGVNVKAQTTDSTTSLEMPTWQ